MRHRISIFSIAILFIVAGALHLVLPQAYVKQMPAIFPAPWLLVIISGLFEILGGLGVLVSRTRRFSGFGLIALLIAVFPVNVHMYNALSDGQRWTWLGLALLIRLPIQLVLIAWIYRSCCKPRPVH